MAEKTVPISVLIVCVILTLLVTSAIFMCITCITIRIRRKEADWESQRDNIVQQACPTIPHAIDLRDSYMGPPSRMNAAPSKAHGHDVSRSISSLASSEFSTMGEESTLLPNRMGASTTPIKELPGSTTWEKSATLRHEA